MDIVTFTEVGGHAVNEDAFEVHQFPDDPESVICCLADGQGGQPGGGAAAQLACQSLLEAALEKSPRQLAQPSTWVSLLTAVDAAVAAAPKAGFTTLIGAAILGNSLVGASNGDSAVFAFSQGRACNVTQAQVKNPPTGSGGASVVPFGAVLVPPWKVLVMSDGVWKYIDWDLLVKTASEFQGQHLIDTLQSKARLPGNGEFQDDFTVVLMESSSDAP